MNFIWFDEKDRVESRFRVEAVVLFLISAEPSWPDFIFKWHINLDGRIRGRRVQPEPKGFTSNPEGEAVAPDQGFHHQPQRQTTLVTLVEEQERWGQHVPAFLELTSAAKNFLSKKGQHFLVFLTPDKLKFAEPPPPKPLWEKRAPFPPVLTSDFQKLMIWTPQKVSERNGQDFPTSHLLKIDMNQGANVSEKNGQHFPTRFDLNQDVLRKTGCISPVGTVMFLKLHFTLSATLEKCQIQNASNFSFKRDEEHYIFLRNRITSHILLENGQHVTLHVRLQFSWKNWAAFLSSFPHFKCIFLISSREKRDRMFPSSEIRNIRIKIQQRIPGKNGQHFPLFSPRKWSKSIAGKRSWEKMDSISSFSEPRKKENLIAEKKSWKKWTAFPLFWTQKL